MANPNVAELTSAYGLQQNILLDAATAQNVLANKASSGAVIKYKVSAWNVDGTNDASLTLDVYDQDGTGIASNTGKDEATTGTDVVAGSASGSGPKTINIAADSGVQVVMAGVLNEDESLVATATNANDIGLQVEYWVLS